MLKIVNITTAVCTATAAGSMLETETEMEPSPMTLAQVDTTGWWEQGLYKKQEQQYKPVLRNKWWRGGVDSSIIPEAITKKSSRLSGKAALSRLDHLSQYPFSLQNLAGSKKAGRFAAYAGYGGPQRRNTIDGSLSSMNRLMGKFSGYSPSRISSEGSRRPDRSERSSRSMSRIHRRPAQRGYSRRSSHGYEGYYQ